MQLVNGEWTDAVLFSHRVVTCRVYTTPSSLGWYFVTETQSQLFKEDKREDRVRTEADKGRNEALQHMQLDV